jgi:hypothetical protein
MVVGHIEYFKRIEEAEKKVETLVCCSTCWNEKCKMGNRFHDECLSHPKSFNPPRNHLLYWSEETGYLPKMHEKYCYIHWREKPDFIKRREFSV